MVDILHKVGIKSSSEAAVYRALTTIDGLAGWWTEDTKGDVSVGGVIEFRFGAGGIDMKVRELVPNQRVVWEVAAGPEEWLGTTVSLTSSGRTTGRLFASSMRAGRSRWTSCIIAPVNGASFC